jgi:hypothetical protein
VRAGYLLDTDWIIDHLNGVAAVAARLKELQPAGLAASIISLAELYEGVHYSRDRGPFDRQHLTSVRSGVQSHRHHQRPGRTGQPRSPGTGHVRYEDYQFPLSQAR